MAKDRITLNVLADITKKVKDINFQSDNIPRERDNRPYTNQKVKLENQQYINKEISSEQTSDRALVVFTGSDINIAEKLECILGLKDQRVRLSLVFSKMAEKLLNIEKIKEKLRPEEVYLEEDIIELKKVSLEYNYIISPNITINTMSKTTKGFIDEFIPNLIWTFLYLDKNVYVDFESTLNYLGMDCKNKKVENIILEQIKSLKDMGATEIISNKYMDSIYKNKNYSNILSKKTGVENHSLEKKIYTKNDINSSLKNGDTIILRRGDILTPLARDEMRSRGINIKFE